MFGEKIGGDAREKATFMGGISEKGVLESELTTQWARLKICIKKN
jgi:hypothetical protein